MRSLAQGWPFTVETWRQGKILFCAYRTVATNAAHCVPLQTILYQSLWRPSCRNLSKCEHFVHTKCLCRCVTETTSDQVQTDTTWPPSVPARLEYRLGVFQKGQLTWMCGADREQMTGVGEKCVLGSFTTGAVQLVLLGWKDHWERNRQAYATDGRAWKWIQNVRRNVWED